MSNRPRETVADQHDSPRGFDGRMLTAAAEHARAATLSQVAAAIRQAARATRAKRPAWAHGMKNADLMYLAAAIDDGQVVPK